MKLNTIKSIMETMGADLVSANGLVDFYAKVENAPFMPLVIEGIGKGPYDYQAVSVCHYFEQNGDLMQDPEIMFEFNDGEFFPFAIQQAPVNRYAEVYDVQDGKPVRFRPGLKRELEQFARMWDRNLKTQRFVEAAQTAAAAPQTKGDG